MKSRILRIAGNLSLVIILVVVSLSSKLLWYTYGHEAFVLAFATKVELGYKIDSSYVFVEVSEADESAIQEHFSGRLSDNISFLVTPTFVIRFSCGPLYEAYYYDCGRIKTTSTFYRHTSTLTRYEQDPNFLYRLFLDYFPERSQMSESYDGVKEWLEYLAR